MIFASTFGGPIKVSPPLDVIKEDGCLPRIKVEVTEAAPGYKKGDTIYVYRFDLYEYYKQVGMLSGQYYGRLDLQTLEQYVPGSTKHYDEVVIYD